MEDAAKSSVQESVERTAALTDMLFGSPPRTASYLFVLATAGAGLLLAPGTRGLLVGFLVLSLPGVVAGLFSAPLANALGGTFYHRRAAFLAAVGNGLVLLVLAVGEAVSIAVPVNPVSSLLIGYALNLALRHSVLFVTSDNRHRRSLPVTLLPYAVAMPMLLATLQVGPWEAVLMVVLPLIYIGGVVFFLGIFDAPMVKNFGVSAFDLFRYFLDHFTTGNPQGEAVMDKFAEPIQAKVGVVAFRRLTADPAGDAGAGGGAAARGGPGPAAAGAPRAVKACIVVPALHPGPVGELGGSDLPEKITEQVTKAEHVLVPHGSATHDFNPIRTAEVERVGKAVNEALGTITFHAGGSRLAGQTRGVRVGSQFFGDGVLLTYTSWPEPIDDVSYGVGHAAELSARIAGADEAIFVDCHNSLTPGAGAVFPCTPRADRIVDLAHDATREAARQRAGEVRVGVAQVRGFRRDEGIGKQGVQVLAVEAGGQRVAYVLWDGNNMLPEVTDRIQAAVEGLVDRVQVMTTDNHSVNLVAGGYNPVGHRAPPKRIAEATREALEAALEDLEPVECGVARLTLAGLRVFGHEKTARLTASVNVMTSIAGQVLLSWILVVGLATLLLVLVGRGLTGLGAP